SGASNEHYSPPIQEAVEINAQLYLDLLDQFQRATWDYNDSPWRILQIGSNIEDILDALAVAPGLASPLRIDLNRTGAIDVVWLASSTAVFDVDGDGFAEHVGWVGATDGFVVYDRNEDGVINDISELFGSVQEEGFTHLALLDSNADGVIDASDEKWS